MNSNSNFNLCTGPSRNVRLDKYVANVDETINCISDGYPEADYFWNCTGGLWSANGPSLVCAEPAVYTCNCSAENKVNEAVKKAYWIGIIIVSKGIITFYFPLNMTYIH